MRIVAGKARGRPLKAPKDARVTRPTADRVRETLFNVLGQWMEGLKVLDLFAGTGALGLEAISRGASSAVLVERDREAAQLCRDNAASLGFAGQVRVVCAPVERALKDLARAGERFDLIFADPPYAAREIASLLEALGEGTLLSQGARVCLEHDRREQAPERAGALARIDQRRFGDTLVSIYAADFA